MTRVTRFIPLVGAGVVILLAASSAQIGRLNGQDWATARADLQRTGWVRTDPFVSRDTMTKGTFKLQWKAKLDPPSITAVNIATGPGGLSTPFSYVAAANTFYGIDNETGFIYWKDPFTAPAGANVCAAEPTSALARQLALVPTAAQGGRGFGGPGGGGRGPFMGGVGEPGEGVPERLMSGGMFGPGSPPRGGGAGAQGGGGRGAQQGAAPSPQPGQPGTPPPTGAAAGQPPGAPGVTPPGAAGGAAGGAGAGGGPGGRPGGPGGPGGGRGAAPVYAIASDGVLRTLGRDYGKQIQQPLPFLTAGAHVNDLSVIDGVAYALTSGNCAGVANGLWSFTVGTAAPALASVKLNGGNPVGAPAYGTNGLAYVAIANGTAGPDGYANAIVAIDIKSMTVADSFTQPGADFTSTPVLFKLKDRDLVAAATRDGRIFLLDAASLGGADHSTPLAIVASVSPRGVTDLATWEEGGAPASPPAAPPATAPAPTPTPPTPGVRWILATTNTGIAALKVDDANGSITAQPVWTGPVASPSAAVVVNGVVFVAARAPRGVIHALDGLTGKSLWTSGTTLTGAVIGSPWTSLGQVHVATSDGTVWAFGFPMERY